MTGVRRLLSIAPETRPSGCGRIPVTWNQEDLYLNVPTLAAVAGRRLSVGLGVLQRRKKFVKPLFESCHLFIHEGFHLGEITNQPKIAPNLDRDGNLLGGNFANLLKQDTLK